MMQGQWGKAWAAVRAMLAGVPQEWAAEPKNAAIVDGYATAPLEVMKRFGRWDDLLAEPERPEVFPIARAMRHELRGVAFAAKGRLAAAREEQKLFHEAVKRVPDGATFGNNAAADLFAVAADVLEGEILARE